MCATERLGGRLNFAKLVVQVYLQPSKLQLAVIVMVEFTTLLVQVVLTKPMSTVDLFPAVEIISHSITGVQFPTNLTLHHICTLEYRSRPSSTTPQRGLDSERFTTVSI